MKTTIRALSIALLSLSLSVATASLAACGSGKGGSKADKKGGKAKPAPIVEHDLSGAHEIWKGWLAKGPKNAKVMPDGVKGARIAGRGKGMLDSKPGDDLGYDIIFRPKTKDLKEVKKMLAARVKNSGGKMKFKVLKEDPSQLSWVEIRAKSKVYHLAVNAKVSGRDISCTSNLMIGAGNEAELARFEVGCKSLRKK